MSERVKDDLERTEELFDFLQGTIPDGYKLPKGHAPKLTPDQAWTVIWYLGNQYWQVKDSIDRCDVCGTLYDSECSGECMDYGNAPYSFCNSCADGTIANKKRKRDPDRVKPVSA